MFELCEKFWLVLHFSLALVHTEQKVWESEIKVSQILGKKVLSKGNTCPIPTI